MQVVKTSTVNPSTVLTLADVKRHLRVTHTLEDDLIESIRNASIRYVEDLTNTNFGRITAVGYLPTFRHSYFPVGPVVEVSGVTYETDNSGTTADLSGSMYHTDIKTNPARIAFSDYPAPYEFALMPVGVSFTYGYAYDAVPANLIAAVKLVCGHLYENRQAEITGTITTMLKMGVDALCAGDRIMYQP